MQYNMPKVEADDLHRHEHKRFDVRNTQLVYKQDESDRFRHYKTIFCVGNFHTKSFQQFIAVG